MMLLLLRVFLLVLVLQSVALSKDFSCPSSPSSQLKPKQDITPGICIISRHTESITSYGRYTRFIQEHYAGLHGYLLLIDEPSFGDEVKDDYQFFPKLSLILQVMQDPSLQCNYVVWMDADFIPLDISFRLEHFILQYPSAELIASKDVSNLINTGAFIVRRSAWSEQFLIKWLAMRLKPEAINDQSGFDLLFNRYLDNGDRQKIAMLLSHEFNSAAPAMSQQLPSHKFLHLAAEDDSYREAVFSNAAWALCNALEQSRGPKELPHQLGLGRYVLLNIAVERYSALKRESEASLRNAVDTWESSISSIDDVISLSTRYRRASSKLMHALAYRDSGGQESINSLKERWKLVELIFSVIHSLIDSTADTNVPWVYDWKYLSSKISKISFQAMATGKVVQNKGTLKDILPALPELLKLLAEVTYEFLLHGEEFLALSSQSSSVDIEMPSKFSLVNELDVARVSLIPQVIAILSVIVHPSQRHIVDHMSFEFAQRYSTVGVDLTESLSG